MREKNTGGPAFPAFDRPNAVGRDGMTLRDYFAAHAPDVPITFERKAFKKAVQTAYDTNEVLTVMETDAERLVRWRFHYADDMLKARDA